MSTLRKIITTGFGAALMTEGGLRNALTENLLTKQAKDYVLRQAQKGKEEVIRLVMSELKKFLTHVDLQEEIQKAMQGLNVQIEAKISFAPSGKKQGKTHIAKLKF